MTNVLPQDALRHARTLYRSRFVFVGSLILIVCALLTFAALLPAYLVVGAEEEAPREASEISITLEEETDRADIARARTLVKEFRMFATSTVGVFPLFENVLDLRPKGVFVERLDLVREEKGTLTLSGKATSREAITSYRTALEETKRFGNVSIPLGVLTGAANDHFTLTLSGSF